jgi:hypothetical protein
LGEEDGNNDIRYTDIIISGSRLRRRILKFWHFHCKKVAKLFAAHQE